MDTERNVPSRAEIRALRAVVRYGTVRLAAEALHLSRHTVDCQIDHLRLKSGQRHIAQIVAWAAEQGWLSEGAEPGEK